MFKSARAYTVGLFKIEPGTWLHKNDLIRWAVPSGRAMVGLFDRKFTNGISRKDTSIVVIISSGDRVVNEILK